MKKLSIAAAAAVATLAASGAHAADMRGGYGYAPSYAPAVVSAYSWMGPYVGANLGYQWGRVNNNPTRPDGMAGGVQVGYNWQSGQFVLGAEADLQLSGAHDTFAGWKFSNPWFSTIRGRAGVAMNNILFYGTVGFAIGGIRAEAGGWRESKTHTGWAAGLGMEVGLTPNWTAKAEYLYIDLASRSFSVTGQNNAISSNLLRFGVNYHF